MKAVKIAGPIAAMFVVASTAFAQTGPSMTITGCLMGENDYRKAHDLNRGRLGGIGLGDEFVLVEGSCNSKSDGKAYRLTGKPENQMKALVGHQVEVTGRYDKKHDETAAAGQTKAYLPPEFRIASFREATSASANPAPATAAAVTPAPAPEQTVARNETRPERTLPNTASNDPLIALVGGVSLMFAFGLFVFRSRLA